MRTDLLLINMLKQKIFLRKNP